MTPGEKNIRRMDFIPYDIVQRRRKLMSCVDDVRDFRSAMRNRGPGKWREWRWGGTVPLACLWSKEFQEPH